MKKQTAILGIVLIVIGLSMLGFKFLHLKPILAAVLIFMGANMIVNGIIK